MSDQTQFQSQARKIAQVATLIAASFASSDLFANETLPPVPTAAASRSEESPARQEAREFEVKSFQAEPIRRNPSLGSYARYPASEMLEHVAERMPTFRDFGDAPTTLHENIHFLHAHLRNTYGNLPEHRDQESRQEGNVRITWNAVQPVWLGDGRVAMVKDPDSLQLRDVLPHVPESLRRSRTGTYLENDTSHQETNILNEHAAYLLDAEYSLKIHDYVWTNYRNDHTRHVIDAADGAAEFVSYSLALAKAIESSTGNYRTAEEQTQALAVIKELCERSADVYKQALDRDRYPMFTATRRDYLSNLRDKPDAEPLREFAKRTYGEKWFEDLVGR